MVYIKKIEMKGFKSYGEIKVTVPLSEGFTCIIGPNGSGKSNIADALLFVLGGLSAKSMRAEVFSDLIYTGKNTQYAEISLYFDNSDNKFPVDKKEVVITRIVFKDGRSIYKVNKKKETRSYVLDLLSEVGITPDGYNIVRQGEIMNFINMTSLERREIIEDISGIAEFEEKKEKGLRELERTEENLARVNLIIEEVKKQMDRLENEKNDAIRYNFLKSEIQKLKGIFLHSKLEKYNRELDSKRKEVIQIKKNAEKLNSELKSYLDSIANLERVMEDLEEDLERKNSEYLEINGENEDLKRKFSELEQNIKHEEENLERNKEEIERLNREKEETLKEINKIEEDLRKIEKSKISVEKEINAIESEIKELEEEIERKTDFLKRDYDIIVETLENQKEIFYEKKNKLSSLEDRKLFLSERLKEKKEIYEEKKAEYTKNKSELQSYEASLLSTEEDIKRFESEMEKIESRIYHIEGELWKKKEDLLRIKSKRSFDLEKDRVFKEVLSSGIRGIYGRVKDLGKTKKEYSVALEVAGGRRLDYIVVDTDETAKACVKYLKRRKAGRATFIPLNKIKRRTPREVKKKEGFVDYAINLVEFDDKFKPVFEYVFGDTVVIKNIDFAENFEIFRRVTLDGDLIETTGVVTGGFYKPKGGFADKDEETRQRTIENEIKALNNEKNELEKKLRDLKEKLKNSTQRRMGLESGIKTLKMRLETEEIENLERDIKIEQNKLREIEKNIQDLRKEYEVIESSLNEMEAKKGSLYSELMERSGEEIGRINDLKGDLEIKKKEYQKIDRDFISKKSRLEMLNQNYSGILERLKEKNLYSQKMSLKIEEYKKELKNVQERCIETEERIKFKIKELEDTKNRRTKKRDELNNFRKEKDEIEKNLMNLNTRISILEQSIGDIEKEIEETSEEAELYEKTEIVDDIKQIDFKIKRMEREKESLEPINMRAIEEYEETEQRYLVLKTKYEKILKEKEAVLEFINKVEKRKREVFMETFNRIAENFSSIFFELSGGEGNLLIENEADPFSGGIDIEAKPRGKEIKKIASMSGGEKALTALAFVFAIQRYKTAPFYLFDEIDAHLDDENVRKVAEMIKRVSKESQFIVITLRDAMMASADRLFGVSMKDGISRIVAVELQDTAKYEGKKFEVVEEV
ncbi:MAG TPA: chromosome segregation protein SMC [Methanomicrobia archaeon]|nr:chromosome segregation protein SMC [Methanomicrobia archaeon]